MPQHPPAAGNSPTGTVPKRNREKVRMGHRCCLDLILCSVVGLGGWQAALRAAEKKPTAAGVKISFTKEIAPLISKYCASCHSGEKPKGGLNLAAFKNENAALNQWSIWEKVAQRVRDGEMPPKRKPQPTAVEKAQIIGCFRHGTFERSTGSRAQAPNTAKTRTRPALFCI